MKLVFAERHKYIFKKGVKLRKLNALCMVLPYMRKGSLQIVHTIFIFLYYLLILNNYFLF